MSGISEFIECTKCGETAYKYYDWKPHEFETHECMNYECGFQYFVEDGIDKSCYMTKEEIKECRELFCYEELEHQEEDKKKLNLFKRTALYCSQLLGSLFRY